jgi:hypothetical protein
MPADGAQVQRIMALALGLPKASRGAGKESGGGDLDMDREAKHSAARALRTALRGDDDAAITAAFKRMYDECARAHGDDEESEDDEEY